MKRALLLLGWLGLSGFDFGYKVGAPKYRDNIIAVYHGDVNIGHYHLVVDTAIGFKVAIREIASDEKDSNGGCPPGASPSPLGNGCIISGMTTSGQYASSGGGSGGGGTAYSSISPEIDLDMSELDAIADALKYFKHKMELVQAAKVEDK